MACYGVLSLSNPKDGCGSDAVHCHFIFELLLGFLWGCLAVLSVLSISHFRGLSVTPSHS